MSHFVVLCLLPGNTPADRDVVESKLKELLAPYSENLKVEEYDRKCYCIGSQANRDAREAAVKEVGYDIDGVRTKYHQLPVEERSDAKWKELIAPLLDAEKRAFEAHPQKDSPDPECGSCSGTGTYRSTYNPESKWDWFQIGGRWTGVLVPDYDPNKDPDNIEVCSICAGTGQRNDPLGQQARAADPGYTCNGCDGEGKRVKWPTQWRQFGGDIMPLADAPESFTPYALVTPEGEWLEKGEMGWFGTSSNEKDEDDWKNIVKAAKEKYSDALAVVVDCHI